VLAFAARRVITPSPTDTPVEPVEPGRIARRTSAAGPGSASIDLAALKVLIVQDWIVQWGGAERTLEEMLRIFPDATVVVGVLGRDRRGQNAVTRRVRETWLARLPFARSHHRWYLPLYPVVFSTLDTRGFDLVVSSTHAFAKMVRTAPGVPHLCYCYSPPRYLWDLQETYQRDSGLSGKILGLAAPLLRAVDRRGAAQVDRFVGISRYIADRIRRAYGRDASVVYPPVGVKPTSMGGRTRGDTLLSLSRLVPYKRVDLAILAANQLGHPLIVAGEGPERQRLERLAGPTVTFVGEVSEERAGELMETCGLMLFCAEEDFGIAPLEANAHGLPVVAFGRGGSLETMRDGVSGLFFDEATAESLVQGIRRAWAHPWQDASIRANARRFTAQRFREDFAAEVRLLLQVGARAC
jgi:glycosyltransferase involved in cell wall biosynthesis